MPERADWEAWLAERPIGVVATVGPDGLPHAVPVALLVRDGKVYIWCGSRSVKARNATRAGRAALTAYKSNLFVLLRCGVRAIRDGEPGYDEIVSAHLDRYGGDRSMNDLVLELTPERVTARI